MCRLDAEKSLNKQNIVDDPEMGLEEMDMELAQGQANFMYCVENIYALNKISEQEER
ncbi:hypothetical protein [Bacillus sp. AFS015802]|uniref:hypothetical protein n=1 Tax=Bacillus sp. AFS015802 TaxID=2033486 RepID=UPI0015CF3B98|nr:hypothetical protein [Bacillus sp. AFS015802]